MPRFMLVGGCQLGDDKRNMNDNQWILAWMKNWVIWTFI
jgi:hypothetical protein